MLGSEHRDRGTAIWTGYRESVVVVVFHFVHILHLDEIGVKFGMIFILSVTFQNLVIFIRDIMKTFQLSLKCNDAFSVRFTVLVNLGAVKLDLIKMFRASLGPQHLDMVFQLLF